MSVEDQARKLLQEAIAGGISDIHILPKKSSYNIYFRVSGKLHLFSNESLEWGKRFISYLKFLANLDVGEKRRPQSGSTPFQIKEECLELRLSTITNYLLLESMVIRLLRPRISQETNLQSIFPKDVYRLRDLVRRKSGLILFSGPVGSGKTTMIYQLLRQRMDNEELQIITMEDPVEIFEPRFLQTEVNERAQISYDLLIKSSLRHHPDILMIGEVRDEETARMIIRGALTGHLMIATIHAKNSQGVIARLEELQISRQQLSQTLIGVISQRLVPKFCPFCQGPCQLSCNFISQDRKRASIFELMEGKTLHNYLLGQTSCFTTLNDKLRKAWAYGFIDQKTYRHFEII